MWTHVYTYIYTQTHTHEIRLVLVTESNKLHPRARSNKTPLLVAAFTAHESVSKDPFRVIELLLHARIWSDAYDTRTHSRTHARTRIHCIRDEGESRCTTAAAVAVIRNCQLV